VPERLRCGIILKEVSEILQMMSAGVAKRILAYEYETFVLEVLNFTKGMKDFTVNALCLRF